MEIEESKNQKITICSICEKFNIKQFNILYKHLLEFNIDPLDIKIRELSQLIFKENKNFSFDDLILTTLKDKDTNKIEFYGKWIKLKDKNEKIKEIKDEYEKEIDIIINDLNQKRKDFFHLKGQFDKNVSTIKMIKKYLKDGFKVDDFILVHTSMAKIYLKHEDQKIATGFYYRPTTLYNGKFISRVENAKSEQSNEEKLIKKYSNKDIEIILKDLNKKRKFYFDFDNEFLLENNKELIKQWLNKDYKIEDFLLVHEYIAKLYKENQNEKIAKGFYYRPSTIYDDKFPNRVENAKTNIIIEKEKIEDEKIENIDDIISKIKKKNKEDK